MSSLETTSNDGMALLPGSGGAQLFDDLAGPLPRAREVARLERNGADHRMAAAAVALAYLRDVDGALVRKPRVGADRDLGARGRERDRHHVVALGEQIVGDEL